MARSKTEETLNGRLQAEAAGILAWAVQGCLEWQRRGLSAPADIDETTHAYRKESDTLGNFLESAAKWASGALFSSADLWKAYSNWAIENGVGGLNRKAFKNQLESRGFKSAPDWARSHKEFCRIGSETFLGRARRCLYSAGRAEGPGGGGLSSASVRI